MISRWNVVDAREYASRHDPRGELERGVIEQAYATTLLGADNDLAMHGGGNTSVKAGAGDALRALYVKASGTPLGAFTPDHFVVMGLDFLENLKSLDNLDDEAMTREFRRCRLSSGGKLPSIETLMHAFVPAKIVSHTHPAAILKIANRAGGGELVKKCFGEELAVVPYARMGFDLAKAVSGAARENAGSGGVVMRHHGLVAWGGDPREVYERTIAAVTKAEVFLARIFTRTVAPPDAEITLEESARNYEAVEPAIKKTAGFSAGKTCYALLNSADILELFNSPDGKRIACDPPMTPDYPMYTRVAPVWIDGDITANPETVLADVNLAAANVIIHPKIGAVCFGENETKAKMLADFTRQALSIRRAVFETGGTYERLAKKFILDMQYRGYQTIKYKSY